MISVDTSKTSDDLQKYIADVERRLKSMVAGFAYRIALEAEAATPIGKSDIIETGLSNYDNLTNAEKNYFEYYRARAEQYKEFAPMQVGYHKSAWRYSENGNFEMIQGTPLYNAPDMVHDEASVSYKLGDTFMIGAKGFGGVDNDSFKVLEGTDNKITGPAMAEIMMVYQVDLKRYYNEG